MKLSIVIINYKTWTDLDSCIETIKKFPLHAPYEILIIDNDSKQKEQEEKFLHKWGKEVILLNAPKNLGFGQGADLGFKNAKGEYFLLMNPDIKAWEGSLNEAINFMDAHKEIGILGGQLRYLNGLIQDSYRNFPKIFDQFIKRIGFLRKLGFLRKRVMHYLMWNKDPEKTEIVDWVVGGFMFIRNKAYSDSGGFDPRYFLFMEDVDLCRKMWDCGWHVIYHPKVKATHGEHRLSAGGISDIFKKKTLRIHLMSTIKYFWKYKFKKLPRAKR